AFLLSQLSPKQVLEDLVRTLEARQVQVSELVAAARQWQQGLEALQAMVKKVLEQVPHAVPRAVGPAHSANGTERWIADAIAFLTDWQNAGKSSDCPLPDLYRRAQQSTPGLTIGNFHDGLRRLHDQEKVYLHPWTGPMYEIPEPPYALLIGHEIVY